ncbi:hypothetical protein [Streptomyces acidiscabies]|uniref:Uncharacterized protein n=1 Tax=Streptomyces acidiscabies TaxID=42234 RepID=A0ABU4LWA6_9ACTN|nr:hypothetical protein [Streptomyces acidiscabies]MDX3019846.1 hypothetical protein [Streptomyces acidiscabies]
MTDTSSPPPDTPTTGVVISAAPTPPKVPGLLPASAVGADRDREKAIREWLASAHRKTEQAHTDWATHGVSLLPLGRPFSAVRIPGSLIHLVSGSTAHKPVASFLAEELRGPVIHDRHEIGVSYYALVPAEDLKWPYPEAPYLTSGTTESWLGVPDISRTRPPGCHWTVPPRFVGDLCRIERLAGFILRSLPVLHAHEEALEKAREEKEGKQ